MFNTIPKALVQMIYIRHAQHKARGPAVACRGFKFGLPTLDEIEYRSVSVILKQIMDANKSILALYRILICSFSISLMVASSCLET
jgi:hypothetical protein